MWFRYHHLFADALRARLAREAGPGAAAALHRRASAWFGREGLLPEAIGHALAGDAAEDAATWIEALTPTLFATMSIHQTLAAWLAALFGLLARLRDLGATLLLVEHLPDYGGPPPSAACRDGSSSFTRSETGFTSSRYHPAARPNPSPRSHPASQR